ncbi:MAG: hypothetical protein ACI4JC_03040 [Faecalibacterium sp.]
MKQVEYRVEERFQNKNEESRRAAVQSRMETLLRTADTIPEAEA